MTVMTKSSNGSSHHWRQESNGQGASTVTEGAAPVTEGQAPFGDPVECKEVGVCPPLKVLAQVWENRVEHWKTCIFGFIILISTST